MRSTADLPAGATPPQPEPEEPRLADPRLRDLSFRDWRAVLVRGGKEARADSVTDVAAALAYYAFLAIPAVREWLGGLAGWIEPELVLQLRLVREVPGVGARLLQIYGDLTEDLIRTISAAGMSDEDGSSVTIRKPFAGFDRLPSM